jgi:RNA recognition motif-containing protein
VSENHLQEIFGHYGSVKSIDIQIDRRTGVPRGGATITFSTEKDAQQALFYLDGGLIDGNKIKVSFVLVPTRGFPSREDDRYFFLFLSI